LPVPAQHQKQKEEEEEEEEKEEEEGAGQAGEHLDREAIGRFLLSEGGAQLGSCRIGCTRPAGRSETLSLVVAAAVAVSAVSVSVSAVNKISALGSSRFQNNIVLCTLSRVSSGGNKKKRVVEGSCKKCCLDNEFFNKSKESQVAKKRTVTLPLLLFFSFVKSRS
jgi:hypothetical protein